MAAISTTSDTFQNDVLERSQEIPVLVDFWADWCQPCLMLAPILESAAQSHSDQFVLVKALVDDVQSQAAEYGVQALPTVLLFYQGEVVDGFQGLLPESQFEQWWSRAESSLALKRTATLETSQPEIALSSYESLLASEPDHAEAALGRLRVLIQLERNQEAHEQLAALEKRGFLEPEAERLKSLLTMEDHQGVDVEALRTRLQASPDDYALQVELAQALSSHQQYEEALQLCLDVVEQDRTGQGEAARLAMLDIFRVLPDDSQLVADYRRKLSMALF